MSRVVVIFGLACLLLGACVPNKKIVYLQSENELDKDFPTDTVLRSYDLANYEYRIQPEDILSIRIESLTEEEFDIFSNQGDGMGGGTIQNLSLGGYLVDKDGTIDLPEIGRLYVGGKTLHHIKDNIQLEAQKFVDEPIVRVRLLNFRVTLLGEVKIEGVINSLDNRFSIMEAIGSAGGLNDMADRSNVKIIRQKNGQAQVFYVNLLNESVMDYNSFFLHQNDILVVPPLKQRPFRRYFGQNLSLFVSTISVILLTVNLLNN